MDKEYIQRHYGNIELVTASDVAKMLGIYRKGKVYEACLEAKIWLHRHKIKGVLTYMSQSCPNHWKKAEVEAAIAKDRAKESVE